MANTIIAGKITNEDYFKGIRMGNREAELEDSTGFKAVHRTHRSKKAYTRKDKHKSGRPDFFMPGDQRARVRA